MSEKLTVGRELEQLHAAITQHEGVRHAVVVEIADEAACVAGAGEGGTKVAFRREDAVGIGEQPEAVRAFGDEQMVAAVPGEIDHAGGTVKFRRTAGRKGCVGRVGEGDFHAGLVRLLEFEREPDLRVFAALEGGGAGRRRAEFRGDLPVQLELLRSLVLLAGAVEQLAEAVVHGGMLRLELHDLAPLRERIVVMGQALVGEAELEADGIDRLVDGLRRRQGFHRLGKPGAAQVGAADQVIRGGGIRVARENGLGLGNDFVGAVGEEQSVGEVEERVSVGGLQREGLWNVTAAAAPSPFSYCDLPTLPRRTNSSSPRAWFFPGGN